MKLLHSPWHWVAVAAVLGVALFTLGEAHGQSSGASAAFEGRPAMAGPQAGTGALAGPPQGGVAPQQTQDPGGGVRLQRPGGVDKPAPAGPDVPRDPGVASPGREGTAASPGRDSGIERRDRDSATGNDGTARKARRAGKRTYERARRGIPGIDS